jgi:hypothetical protein
MSDVVIIPLGALGVLELPRDVFERHLRGCEVPQAAIAPLPPSGSAPELIDARALAKQLSVPTSWIMERARSNSIPNVRIGRYVRFNLAAVCDELTGKSLVIAKPLNGKGKNSTANRLLTAELPNSRAGVRGTKDGDRGRH